MEYKYPQPNESKEVLFTTGEGSLSFDFIASLDVTKNILTLDETEIQVTQEQADELLEFFRNYKIVPIEE